MSWPERSGRQLAVSILVLLDFVLKAFAGEGAVPRESVSILVLLDFVLKATGDKDRRMIICQSFNPCFIGFCS